MMPPHLIGILLLSAASTASADTIFAVGKAYSLDSGALKYSEVYYCSDDGASCEVRYQDSEGKLIAEKQVNFSPIPHSPSLRLKDYRLSREISLDGGDPDVVVDAGFDNYVRLRWDEIDSGEVIRFPFLIVGRDAPLKMKAKKSNNSCEQDQLCLQIRVDSWLVGMFAGPINLTYDRVSQRLLRFSGVSNLRDSAGKLQKVDIRYAYSDPGKS